MNISNFINRKSFKFINILFSISVLGFIVNFLSAHFFTAIWFIILSIVFRCGYFFALKTQEPKLLNGFPDTTSQKAIRTSFLNYVVFWLPGIEFVKYNINDIDYIIITNKNKLGNDIKELKYYSLESTILIDVDLVKIIKFNFKSK